MEATLAKSLFKRLGGKIARSARNPAREVWVLRKPCSRRSVPHNPNIAPAVALQEKSIRKMFRLANDLMMWGSRCYSRSA